MKLFCKCIFIKKGKVMKKALCMLVIGSMSLINATNRIYLENQSHRTIGVTVNDKKEVTVAHNVRIFLGNILLDQRTPKALVDVVNVRSLGNLWNGSYNSLEHYLNNIAAQVRIWCSRRDAECSQDAVLVINPSSYGWSVTVRWENLTRSSQEFAMEDYPSSAPKAPTMSQLLNALKQNVQAQNYESTRALVNRYKTALEKVFSGGQLNAIVTGSHPGADAHQKAAAMKLINNALQK
jgi:hypothetical protein